MQQTYEVIQSKATGKPLMIAETASAETGGNKAGWISDALATRIPRSFTAVKAVA